ncbi:hypothetical protein [Turneriella parva]|uniref:Uncharacterized protein n=1 Tax=Turneriella parva (strain ATCC BAA-1111 / DSM 21527 / NCTC 11395 / H) TaxID=869212 RepID=I4B1P4_TURPD|nr:hypothetical protein [Turneriella parva]AFM11201.1 hypothetical protein Turpa_0548 [Turneriella parva DSM 21527]
MPENKRVEKFDEWHARHVVRSLQNRSGEFVRAAGNPPESWGECQDYNASRLITLSHVTYQPREALWQPTALKNRLQLDQRAKRNRPIWYGVEYRMSFQINQRAYEPKPEAQSALWEAKAVYETLQCNARSKIEKNGDGLRARKTWKVAQKAAAVRMQRRRPSLDDIRDTRYNLWDLIIRHAGLTFKNVPPVEDGWHRNVKSRLDRLVQGYSTAAQLEVEADA